ncbi:MAG: type IV pilus biogenesis protein PilM, partial [bacterium]
MKLALKLKKREEPIIEELAAPRRVKRKIKRTGAFVGIDFLSNQIRISQLNKKGKDLRLEKVAFGKIPPEVYRAGRVANIGLLANTIAELCQQAGINGSFATVTLSGTNSVVRTVTLPKMTRSQLRQTIELQLGQFIPFPPEDTVYQYQVIGESVEEEMPMVEVLIVAGRYSIITPLLKAVVQAGFTPVAVKISYLSTLSVLKRYYEDFAQAVAIVDVRDRVTDVAFVAENTFEFSRTIEMGLEGLLGKIATQIGVSSTDVQRKLVEGEIDLAGGKEEEAARLIEAVQSA